MQHSFMYQRLRLKILLGKMKSNENLESYCKFSRRRKCFYICSVSFVCIMLKQWDVITITQFNATVDLGNLTPGLGF